MTPRKELFVKIKKALEQIPALELVDLQRNQMTSERFPNLFIAALINIGSIHWETMTEQAQEGKASISIDFYCRDGWRNQHQQTEDAEEGLMEMDIIDQISEAIQFLRDEQFRVVTLDSDEVINQSMEGIFQYRLTFSCLLYRYLNPQYFNLKIKI